MPADHKFKYENQKWIVIIVESKSYKNKESLPNSSSNSDKLLSFNFSI